MASSKLIKNDTLTETSNAADGFKPATEDSMLSYTSARVAKPVYNEYKSTTTKPKVFGYFTDWSQYDARLQGIDTPADRGRGYDIANVNPLAYDKIIAGFVGIVGFHKVDGQSRDVVGEAAALCGKVKYEPTFLDPWGDFQSYVNVGFDVSGWDIDPMTVTQSNTKGFLGALRDLQAKAKALGHNLELSMSIGGWTMSNGFHETAASDASRKVFAKGLVKLFKQFPMFSGVDLDWEYPNDEAAGNPYGEEDGPNFALLIAEVRKQLDAANRKDVKISIAASAVVKKMQSIDLNTMMNAGMDYINVMTYDFFGTPWAETLAHHTNLKTATAEGWAMETIVDYLLAQGFPAERINVGYAGYTRNSRNTEISSFSPLEGSYMPGGGTTTGTFESGTTEWYDVIHNYLDLENQTGRNGFNVYTDQVCNADYLFNPQSKLFMSLDTPRSVKAKGEYAANLGLGGLFTWTVDQDNGVLVNAAREGLGYEISKKVIEMEPFYFEGINVATADEEPAETPVKPDVNHAPEAVIELMIVGGSRVRLSGAKSSDQDNDALNYSWGVPSDIELDDKTASAIEFDVPKVETETEFTFTLFVRDTWGEPSTQQRFVLSVVPAPAKVQPDEEDGDDYADDEHDEEVDYEDKSEQEEEVIPADESTPYPWWNKDTIYGANWGAFEIVSWKGHNYQVKWWCCGEQPDENCTQGGVWTDLGAY